MEHVKTKGDQNTRPVKEVGAEECWAGVGVGGS